jgi:predicted secreted hydrolase
MGNRTRTILIGIIAAGLLAAGATYLTRPNRLPAVYGPEGYRAVTGPCGLAFPEDHGPHPDFKTEWWYYTGNLAAENGRRFGYQLTFFRSRIIPPEQEAAWPKPASAWRTAQIYLAHAAVSDLDGGKYLHDEQMARGALGMAGAGLEGNVARVRLRGWSADLEPDRHRIGADAGGFALNFDLLPIKPPVAHGNGGYSRKGKAPESASCYFSLTRLDTRGTLRVGPDSFSVTGLSWMDHEFSSAPLEPNLAGWDWFSLQLDDGAELMAYFLRAEDGGFSPASSATFVDASGNPVHIPGADLNLRVLNTWKSSRTGAVYPAGWRLSVAPLSLHLTVSSNLADQEMRTPGTTRVTYWEGSVSVSGQRGAGAAAKAVTGAGYVELTGYETRFDAPM